MTTNELKNQVIFAYRTLLGKWEHYPSVEDMMDILVSEIYQENTDAITNYYRKQELFSDYKRVMSNGPSKEDFDTLCIEIEFDKYDIISCLESLNVVYKFGTVLHKNPQLSLLGDDI